MIGRVSRTATGRLAVVLAFLVAAVLVVVQLLSVTSVRIPLLQDRGDYTVAVELPDVANLATVGQVRIAGIRVGEVKEIAAPRDGRVRVVMTVHPEFAPLHRGATVRVGNRSLVGEAYLSVEDGRGEAIPAGATLPPDAGRSNVELGDVLRSLDPESRAALGRTVRSLGEGTAGTGSEIRATVRGLGLLGRDGHTAVDAIAAQSEDLEALARETATVLAALDTGQGQIATLVENAGRLAGATADQRPAIESSMRSLPGLLASADSATAALTDLAGALGPVAEDLAQAAPDLSDSLRRLPPVTREVRALLPPLSGTLDRAPATLERVPTLGDDLRDLIPSARTALQDVNPMLSYLEPYGADLATFVALFNGVMEPVDEAGHHYAPVQQNVNDSAQSPLRKSQDVLTYRNPYPEPGQLGRPGPFAGTYPRVAEDDW